MMRYAQSIRDAALVTGWPALYLSRLVDRELAGAPETDRVRAMRQVSDELRRVGEAGSARGTAEPSGPDLVAPSEHDEHDELSTDQAADMLGCSTGYVRRLARDGRLPGWQVGSSGPWRFLRADLEAERDARQERSAA